MNNKLVFFDVDGTLLNDKKCVCESTINAIEKLKEHNYIFCIATGRSLTDGIIEIAKIAKLNGYLVLANGNYVWDIKNETLTTLGLPIDKRVLNKFYDVCQKIKRQLNICFCDGSSKTYFFGNDINEINDPKFYLFGQTIYKFSPISELPEELNKPIIHISIKAEEEIIKKIYNDFLEFQDKEIAQISNVSNIYIEAESFGMSKWIGCQYIQNKLNINNDNVYAFGDSENDAVILKNVGHAIAMGNSDDKIKSICETVIGDNNSNDIGNYLLNLLNKNDIEKK